MKSVSSKIKEKQLTKSSKYTENKGTAAYKCALKL